MHIIKQDSVPDQLKQDIIDSPAPPKVRLPVPPNDRLSSPTVRFDGTEVAPDEEHDITSPDLINENDHEVNSAVFDYPAYPVVNSVRDSYDGSQADIDCLFAYREFQE
jgi:hypothetical protein